jgi:thioesterase-3
MFKLLALKKRTLRADFQGHFLKFLMKRICKNSRLFLCLTDIHDTRPDNKISSRSWRMINQKGAEMETEIKVRGYHTDLYQHVNNARYLEFLEEARWQLLEDHTDLESFMKKGFVFFVVNINISYKSQARVNDVIRIHSGMGKIGNKSAVVHQQVLNLTTGQVCVDADITFVVSDIKEKALKLDGEVLKMVNQIPVFES